MRVGWMVGLSVVMGAAGCGGKKETPVADTAGTTAPGADGASAPTTAAPGADDAKAAGATDGECVPAEVQATLAGFEPDFARLDARVLKLCGAVGEARHCVSLDLDSGKRTTEKLPESDAKHLPAYPAGFDDGLLKDETRPVLKLCGSADARCKDLHVGEVFAGHFDKAKARVVLTTWEDDKKVSARIYDTATQAELGVVPIGSADLPDCTFAAFVGESLLLASGACSGGGKAWLADAKTGAKIADVGKSAGSFVRDGQYAEVEGSLWAIRDASGKAVYLQDVTSGEVHATIDLEAAAEGTKAKDEAAFVFGAGAEVVLVEARPMVGTVFIADRKGVIGKRLMPRPCK